MRFFGHIVRKNSWKKRLIQGKVEGKWRKGRPRKTWSHDLNDCTKLDMEDGCKLATDHKRRRELIRCTAAKMMIAKKVLLSCMVNCAGPWWQRYDD